MACRASNVFTHRTRSVALVVCFIGCFLYFIAMITPAWVTYIHNTVALTVGLYLTCVGNSFSDCTTIMEKDAMFRVSQVFGTSGFIVYVLFAISATLTFFWTKHWKKLKWLKLTAGITSLTAGILVSMATLTILQSSTLDNSSLSYSGYIGLVSVVVSMLLSPFYIIDGLTTTKQMQKPRDDRQKRWDRTEPVPIPIASMAPEPTFILDRCPTYVSRIDDDHTKEPITSTRSPLIDKILEKSSKKKKVDKGHEKKFKSTKDLDVEGNLNSDKGPIMDENNVELDIEKNDKFELFLENRETGLQKMTEDINVKFETLDEQPSIGTQKASINEDLRHENDDINKTHTKHESKSDKKKKKRKKHKKKDNENDKETTIDTVEPVAANDEIKLENEKIIAEEIKEEPEQHVEIKHDQSPTKYATPADQLPEGVYESELQKYIEIQEALASKKKKKRKKHKKKDKEDELPHFFKEYAQPDVNAEVEAETTELNFDHLIQETVEVNQEEKVSAKVEPPKPKGLSKAQARVVSAKFRKNRKI